MDYTFQNAIDELEQTMRDRADLIAALRPFMQGVAYVTYGQCEAARALLSRLEKGERP